jgi:hypothetical protein
VRLTADTNDFDSLREVRPLSRRGSQLTNHAERAVNAEGLQVFLSTSGSGRPWTASESLFLREPSERKAVVTIR